MHVTLVEREPLSVLALRHVGPYGASVAAFWQQVAFPWLAANQRLGQPLYGVSYDNPLTTDPMQCRYDVCIAAGAPLAVPGEARAATLPGGRYAVSAFRGTPADMGGAWVALRDGWVPAHGLRPDGRPFIELYPPDPRYDPQSGAFSCELALPVTRT